MSQCFDGTGFGTGAATASPETSVQQENKKPNEIKDFVDDDIPF
jgi:hypothetical protein